MLQKLNRTLEKWMPLITPTSVVLGMLLTVWLKPYTPFVPWIFAFITFAGSLSLNLKDLQRVMTHPLPIIVSLVLLHGIMPLIAWGTGHLMLPGDPQLVTGLVLLLALPTGIVSFMWVSLYKGNIALTLSIILIDTLLSPFIVPGVMSLIVGTNVDMDVFGMMKGLLIMVVAPSVIGMLLNQWTRGRIKTVLGPRLAPFSKIGLAVVIMINSAFVAPFFTGINLKLAWLAVVIIVTVALGYIGGYYLTRALGWGKELAITMTFNCGMRNISAGAVLAIAYFPPAVAMPVIIGMVFQQMMASFFGYFFLTDRSSKAQHGPGPVASGVTKQS
ncbi:Pantothenate precursors transporter PanS [Paenibacillus solanacearum]|uniref:Pantothenates transporter PanS n=1 Tax=Paenibacillus solanacearum TaxID=2048548 RepID=A0A916NJZ2_9BACL|nr:bile acid:sodium symporter family protein [Paenibacillus solanacearum]CAG7641111.1 Pantothenate precursors transporter PanS [Paenibacillus solanacearum]